MNCGRKRFLLTLSCPDNVGIVAAVTGELAAHRALITEAQHFREPVSNSSVLRIMFEASGPVARDMKRLMDGFTMVAERFGMTWEIGDAAERLRELVAASKQGHCLNSFLHRWGRNLAHRNRRRSLQSRSPTAPSGMA